MKFTLLAISILFLFSTITSADLRKGNVGGGGTKQYSFTASSGGQTQVTLMFDNTASDIDLAAGIVVDGEPIFLGLDVSATRNFSQIQFGIGAGTTVFILVDSYRGGSPFRLTINTSEAEIIRTLSVQELQTATTDTQKLEAALRKAQEGK